ncbi:hypothetical protein N9I19_25335 [Peribacillus sp. CSMR9]|nr:hypothetical protein [Peribacillus sp. CSMR9]
MSLCLISFGAVNAEGQDEREPLENGLIEIGYKTVEEAVNECENLFNEDIVLPYKIPPVQFTHYFGRCNKDFGINNDFEIEFFNENTPENHYTLRLRPKKQAISFKSRHIDKTIKLDKGRAFLIKNRMGNVLVFEKENWQYILSIDKRVSEQVPLEVLVDIANSFR